MSHPFQHRRDLEEKLEAVIKAEGAAQDEHARKVAADATKAAKEALQDFDDAVTARTAAQRAADEGSLYRRADEHRDLKDGSYPMPPLPEAITPDDDELILRKVRQRHIAGEIARRVLENVPVAVKAHPATHHAFVQRRKLQAVEARPDLLNAFNEVEWPGFLSPGEYAAAVNALPVASQKAPPPPPPLPVDADFVSVVEAWLPTIDAKYRGALGTASGRDGACSINGYFERIVEAVAVGHHVAFELKAGAVVPPQPPAGASWTEASKNAHPSPCLILKPAPSKASKAVGK